MRPVTEGTILAMHGSLIASGGTTTSTGIDFGSAYESIARYMLHVPPNSAGSVYATIEAGTALASGYSTIGTINAGTATGLHTLDLLVNARYLRSTITSTGGTAILTADVVAKPRTVTG